MIIPGAFATIAEPHVTAQDERIKILNNGVGYSNLLIEKMYGDTVLWTNSAIFFEIVNVSDEIVYDVDVAITTYSKKLGILDEGWLCLPIKGGNLLPGESTVLTCWLNERGWNCNETWIDYSWVPTEDDLETMIPYGIYEHSLEITSVNDNKGMITGTVKNNADYKIHDVSVFIIKYDSQNNIQGILTHESIDKINPGKSKKFSVSTYLPGNTGNEEREILFYNEPARIELVAEGIVTNEIGGYYVGSKFYNSGSLVPEHIDIDNLDKMISNERLCSFSETKVNPVGKSSNIPAWIKNNAGWWAEGQIDDSSFLQGMQFLIKSGIMIIPPTEVIESSITQDVPAWIKNNAGWWAEGQIDDSSFLQGMQFLIKSGIIILEKEDNKLSEEEIQRRADWLWNQSTTVLHVKDPQYLETTEISNYQIQEGELENPIRSDIDESLEQYRNQRLVGQIWNGVKEVVPNNYLNELSSLRLETDGNQGMLAFVQKDPEDSTKFYFGIDPLDAAPSAVFDIKNVKASIVHEFGHVIGGTVAHSDGNIADFDLVKKNIQEYRKIINNNQNECHPNFYDRLSGCMNDDSYMSEFYKKFWSGIMNEFSYSFEYGNHAEFEEDNADFHAKFENRFVTKYSASNPVEDFAESFTAFVLFEDPNFPIRTMYYNPVIKEKIDFFYNYPELIEIRDYIRKNL